MAVETARHEWNSRKKDEVDLALESTSSQLVKQFEKQNKEAVEKAVGEARVRITVEYIEFHALLFTCNYYPVKSRGYRKGSPCPVTKRLNN